MIGNEAGDADSIVSALALAYVDSVLATQKTLTTPVVSIPRADLPLRRETTLLLDYCGVHVDQLLYMDDDKELAQYQSPVLVTLVDHNRFSLQQFDWQVVEILDHHHDEECHVNVQGTARQIAFIDNRALVASTCTLVAERLFATTTTSEFPPQLSLALLGVMLLDTVNMSPTAGKVTPRDQAAIQTLVKGTDWSFLDLELLNDGVVDTDKLYTRLSESKFDTDFWKSLSVRDALRLDYKQFESSQHVFGSSSILLDMPSFLSKPNLEEGISAYMKECGISLLVILNARIRNGELEREMLLCGDQSEVQEMAEYLLTNPGAAEVMQLKEQALRIATTSLTLRHFSQGNSKASRKQVVPVMLNFYDSSSE